MGKQTIVLFLDVAKAFDGIWMKDLLAKCINYNMLTWLILMLQDYLGRVSSNETKDQIWIKISD